ncbi:MAG: DNA alkylation repair protein [Thermodesulfobacteriota bacterium]
MERLRSLANPENAAGMARFGISPHALGVGMPALRAMAREYGRGHDLALALWETGIHEARILAALTDEPGRVTEEQMEHWAAGLDSWDVCDQVMNKLFDRTPFAPAKAVSWSAREEAFVKRAGFVLMATLAVHDKKAPDEDFEAFLPLIRAQAHDPRNFVKKAINWALRQIGKRNAILHAKALALAEELARSDSPSARWVGKDALRELSSPEVRSRLAHCRTKILKS